MQRIVAHYTHRKKRFAVVFKESKNDWQANCKDLNISVTAPTFRDATMRMTRAIKALP